MERDWDEDGRGQDPADDCCRRTAELARRERARAAAREAALEFLRTRPMLRGAVEALLGGD